ncbi:hypothetical protein LDL08_17455 [Nonomuraea glycinis]|uniref:Uncharacterized protein n=1 Tax=Nonomuraea glycinis TaxID=2047744 RepID=A0A918A674_9ACTN|nr:hypothetical protein [Nonomuraea glycinis]MCA2177981.1 hypothetical protein [Nonomuraea glycinis]GGP06323.1 hypothetical protein GCM10012278_29320 [Nonomuraea glycinis]
MRDTSPLREDLQATLDARRDLGPDYEPALVDSLVERLDATIAARVAAELHLRGVPPAKQRASGSAMIPIALGSMGIGIPLTAIANSSGLVAIVVTWIAIVAINMASAMVIMRRP